MSTAHNSWAKYYDFVYTKSFGGIIKSLTANTLAVIQKHVNKGTIIDYGAGTGRITVPLLQNGYEVIAVEQSSEMLSVLEEKLKNENYSASLQPCSIAEYSGKKGEMALCLFTVVSYLTTEVELIKSIQNIANHLNKGGLLFIDFPTQALFKGGKVDLNDFKRTVSITPTETNDLYDYHEKCSGVFNGEAFNYEDTFSLKYWNHDFLESVILANGFELLNPDLSDFNTTGAVYKMYRKSI